MGFPTPQPDAIEAWLPALIMVLGVLALGVLLTFSIRGKVARRHAEAPEPREAIDRIKARREDHDRLAAMTSQFLETARELAAKLDFKAEVIRQLLEEADRRTEKLRSLTDQVRETAAAAAGNDDDPPPEQAPATCRPAAPLATAVYELADAGRDPVTIARQLDEQLGTVELILALRERVESGK